MKIKVPLQKPQPDIKKFMELVTGRTLPEKGVVMEYLIDEEVRKEICVKLLGRRWIDFISNNREAQEDYLKNYIELWYRMGYDYVRFEIGAGFTGAKPRETRDTANLSRGKRSWREEGKGVITTMKDFEKYPWPEVKDFDFFPYECLSRNLPEGMGLMVSHGGGVLENVTGIMGYEGLSYALYDNPELVKAVFNKVGEIIYEFYENVVELENVYAFFQGDDMGFKTATAVSPEVLRRYVLPWHKKYAELAHQHNLLYLLHSCGNIEAIMKDLIQEVRIDGKHSFEDVIMPVADFKKRYGEEIAVLGEVDINILARADEQKLRRYVRKILEICMPGEKYALGSGNSIANYIPLKNYLTMLEEGLNWKG